MSTTGGRAIDDLLAAYAAGTLGPALHRLVAAHLVLKPENRRYVAALEEIGGQIIEEMPSASPPANRDARLAAIFAAADAPRPAPRTPAPCDVVPAPLRDLLGRAIDDVPWRTKLPGIREYQVKGIDASEASFFWIRAGRRMPSHTHDGSEVTLVLRGGFTDVSGHYGRGDIAIADMDVDHRPRADEDEDCICFAVTDAPLRLTGPFGRIVQRILGH